MTPEDAKKHWCVMARAGVASGFNQATTYAQKNWNVEVACVGDQCMVWRWKNQQQRDGYCGLSTAQGAP